jgi:hypothetical protein
MAVNLGPLVPQLPPGAMPGPAVPTGPNGRAPGQAAGSPSSAANAERAQGQTGTHEAKSTDSTQAPLLSFDGDTVEAPRSGEVDTSALGEPTLPASETVLPGAERNDQEAAVAGVVGLLQDALSQGATVQAVGDIIHRAHELAANPEESIWGQAFGPDFGDQFIGALNEIGTQGVDTAFITEHFGADAAAIVSQHSAFAQESILRMLSSDTPLLGLTEEQFAKGAPVAEGVIAELIKGFTTGDWPTLTPTAIGEQSLTLLGEEGSLPLNDSDTFLGPTTLDGKPGDPAKAAQMVALIGEAGFEYLIGMFSKLQSEDGKLHMKQLQATLAALKEQKLGLLEQIQKKTAEIAGKELGSAVQSKKAEEAAECAKNWGIFKAIVMVVVAVVVAIIAIVATPFTGGASLALVAGVACLISCAITIATQIPAMIQAVGLLFKAMGMDGAAKALDKAGAWLQTNVFDVPWVKWTLFAIQIACALVSLVGAIGSLVNVGTQVTTTAAGTAASASAEAIKKATELAQLTALCQKVGAVVQFAAGVAQIGISIGMYQAQKDLIKAQAAVAQLQGQLALLEVQIKDIMAEIARIESKEKAEQDREQRTQDMCAAINDNLSACADKGRDAWNAVIAFGQ